MYIAKEIKFTIHLIEIVCVVFLENYVTCSRRYKSIYSLIKLFLTSNLYVSRRVLIYTIVLTPCEYETLARTCFFAVYISSFFSVFLSFLCQNSARFRLPPDTTIYEAKNEREREKRWIGGKGDLER